MFRAAFLPIIRSSLAVHRHWYIFADLMTVCYQQQDAPGSKRSSNLQKYTNADVRLKDS